MFKRYIAAIAVGLVLFPVAASAEIVLNDAGKAQLASIATQLMAIFSQVSQAQAQGAAYTQSAAFQTQSVAWAQQLTLLQQQLVALLSSSVATPATPAQYASSGTTCPSFYRNVGPGDSGSDIGALQLYLAREGHAQYSGNITGYFDDATTKAVQRYQAYYGLASYGSPETTGYGRVGPGTRASMTAQCNSANTTITTTPPVTVPAYNPYVQTTPTTPTTSYTPVQTPTNYSTGQISLISSLTGQSGGPNSVSFRVNMLPNASCSSANFVLDFGDGQTQGLSSTASCGNQIQTIAHVYPNTGSYTATLTSGNFSTTLPISIQAPNNSLTLSAASGGSSFSSVITATYSPGTTCAAGSYTLAFGDNASQALSFNNSNCSTQTQTITHTYPQAGSYLISASDVLGRTVTTSFTAAAVISAGAGDPFQVLKIDTGLNPSAIKDISRAGRSLNVQGAKIATLPDSSTAIDMNPPGYISTAAHADFNYGTGPFTIDLWFSPATLPWSEQQAGLVMQADSSASDPSLGGAGLELFGNKLAFVGSIGGATYHPYYRNTPMSTSTLAAGQWYHAAVVRSGNVITLFLNGLAQGSVTVSGNANTSSGSLSIGKYGDFAGNYFDGWMDSIRITKGVARWTADFDPLNI